MIATLIGAVVGLGIGLMIGGSLFGLWGAVIGGLIGVGVGTVILASIRRWAKRELPEARGGTVEVAGTEFHPEAGRAGGPPADEHSVP